MGETAHTLVGDNECQALVHKVGQKILKTTILVSLDASELKLKSCLVTNLYLGLGLALEGGSTFADFWARSNNPPNKITESDFRILKEGLDLHMYVHSCDKLKVGMTSDEAKTVLRPEDICLRNIGVE